MSFYFHKIGLGSQLRSGIWEMIGDTDESMEQVMNDELGFFAVLNRVS